jgi:hypothetical protein
MSQEPNADVNFTISKGDKVSPGLPPIVPLMPEMLLINATVPDLLRRKLKSKNPMPCPEYHARPYDKCQYPCGNRMKL